MDSIVSMRKISKFFPGVKALSGVSVDFYPGEIHAILGENGAGKSTLMNILMGMYHPDEGEIYLENEKIHFTSMADGLNAGISMVHQELTPILDMTVAENIYLGREDVSGIFFNRKALNIKTQKLLEKLNIDIKPKTKMRNLSVAEMQLVEIAKAVSLNSKIVIMDEPTSALSEREVDKLFDILNRIKSEGASIIYISHRMDEIFRIADRVTVLRDGKHINTSLTSEIEKDVLITQMVGRELKEQFPKINVPIGEVAVKIDELSDGENFKNISFCVHKGEIFGIAGLMGAGRTELVETIFGLRKIVSGTITINNRRVTIRSPKEAIRNGLALVPEDRKVLGLNLIASVMCNISLPNLSDFCKLNFISKNKERKVTDEYIEKLKIATPNRYQTVNNLSGGNQQKVVIAKWLLKKADIIIMDEPTRGIDVGAKVEIYNLISDLVKTGKSVILVSSEMPEIIGICDRIIVLSEGQITGELRREEFSQEKILTMASMN